MLVKVLSAQILGRRRCAQSLVIECVGTRRVAKGRFPFTADHEDSIKLEAVANVADVVSDTAPVTQARTFFPQG